VVKANLTANSPGKNSTSSREDNNTVGVNGANEIAIFDDAQKSSSKINDKNQTVTNTSTTSIIVSNTTTPVVIFNNVTHNSSKETNFQTTEPTSAMNNSKTDISQAKAIINQSSDSSAHVA
jgi:hypothetical protein